MRRSYRNRLLASLPAALIEQLTPHLTPVDLPVHRTLQQPGEKVETVYFLEDGMCSMVVTMSSGATVEVGRIGRDGFVGAPAILDAAHTPNRCFMAIAGHGYSIKAKILQEQSEASVELRRLLLRSVQLLLVQTAQTAACNRVHELPKRLARWILMCADRIQADYAPVTQELLAMMLGTRRSSISVAASSLQDAGLIAWSRGRMTIQDHAGLEKAACECYRVVNDEYSRLGLL
ncbi:MAG: Crp/Fnr family transcriptional regulator [Acidobacteriaceae bacterium]